MPKIILIEDKTERLNTGRVEKNEEPDEIPSESFDYIDLSEFSC